MTAVGILSDTHGQLMPYLFEFFEGVEHIIHAGDIGSESIVTELEAIAPVTAVRGNTDHGLPDRFGIEARVSVSKISFYVTHILGTPTNPPAQIIRGIAVNNSKIAIFGHTHRPYHQFHDAILFLNPGAAGPRRFDLPRTACRMTISEDGNFETVYHDLETHTPYLLPT